MAPLDRAFMERAEKARDQLTEMLQDRPEVRLVDIGFDPESEGDPRPVVIRVHVQRTGPAASFASQTQLPAAEELGIPEKIDGIPVRILRGDYRLE